MRRVPLWLGLVCASCGAAPAGSSTGHRAPASVAQTDDRREPEAIAVRYLGDVNLPPDADGEGELGGISGLGYDEEVGWLALSDGRGEHGPPRLYRLAVVIDGALRVEVLERIPLRGDFDPRRFDAEGLGVIDGGWLVATEGDHDVPRLAPGVTRFDRSGRAQGALEVPARLSPPQNGAVGSGVRANRGFEALTVSGNAAYAGLEQPLVQDGPRSGPGRAALVRLVRYDERLRYVGELCHRLDPAPPVEEGDRSEVGLSALAALDDGGLLALERTTIVRSGTYDNRIRIYRVDPTTGPDVSRADELSEADALEKALVVDLADLATKLSPPTLDNFEAMAMGPGPDGEPMLLLATDDNFQSSQRTAFVALALDR